MASIKIQDFFNGRFFEIPKYQRGYAWEEQNIIDLFDDIQESIVSNSNHYIGTIVLSKSNEDDKFFIVDGQQRVTTLTLIINALIRELSEKDSQYFERFYLKEDNRHRISPLNRDKQFFTNLLENPSIIGEPQNKSQRFLVEAFRTISLRVGQIPDKLKFLKSVVKLEVMEFIENSEGDAIRIFQTVNDRGKLLSNMEKAKSLLIYFSNRYLDKKLDSKINDYFSDIFEIYDDIKHLGEELGVNLISNKDFNEDNIMRYHFVSYSDQNYEPSANYILKFIKNELTRLRNSSTEFDYTEIEIFIESYIESIKKFFKNFKKVVERSRAEAKYFKLFVILNLSATLYPLIVKLEELELLDTRLTGRGKSEFTFFDLIELIEVRIYKTRGTDPKADISRFVYNIDDHSPEEIENWLIWFNQRWMTKEEFQSNLFAWIQGNRALNHIFIDYCESINNTKYTIEELKNMVSKTPNTEHILSQTPTFSPKSLGFRSKEDFIDHEHNIGNLTILERNLNSSAQNKSPIDKIETYRKSIFIMTKKVAVEIDTIKAFTKIELNKRTAELAEYCIKRWWSDLTDYQPEDTFIN